MATWVKIPFSDQWQNANDVNASGYVIKCYEPGTTTPISMAIDKNGTTTVATAALNADGIPEVSGNEVALYIDRDFKYAIYENATDASNDTNAFFGPIDNVKINDVVATLQADYWVDTYANFRTKLAAGAYSAGDVVTITNSGIRGDFVVSQDTAGTGFADNGGTTITEDGGTTTANDWYAQRVYGRAVNILWFEADSSGLTDSAPAIRAAISYVDSIGGGTIYYPEGTYLLSTLIENFDSGRDIFFEIKSNITHRGDGHASILKAAAGLTATYDWHMFYTNADVENISFYDMKLDNNSQNNPITPATVRATWQIGVVAGSVKNLLVDNVHLANNSGRNSIYTLPAQNQKSGTAGASSTATACYADFSDGDYTDWFIYNLTDKSTARIVESYSDRVVVKNLQYGSDNTFTSGDSFVLVKQSENVVIRNCLFTNMGNDAEQDDHSTVWMLCEGGELHGNMFVNPSNHSTFSGGGFAGCFEVHGSNVKVTNNTVEYYEKAGFVVSAQHNTIDVEIANNTFNNLKQYGIEFWSVTLSNNNPGIFANVNVHDNTFSFIGSDSTALPTAFLFSTLDEKMLNVSIKDNIVTNPDGFVAFGVKADHSGTGTNGVMENTFIEGNIFTNIITGVRFGSAKNKNNFVVKNNSFIGINGDEREGYGVYMPSVLERCSNIIISGNLIKNMGFSGIRVTVDPATSGIDGLEITDNRIIDCCALGTDSFTTAGISIYNRNTNADLTPLFVNKNIISNEANLDIDRGLYMNGFADYRFVCFNTFVNMQVADTTFDVPGVPTVAVTNYNVS